MKYIKFKDVFTIANLFLSFYSVILVFENKLQLASYLIFLNVIILDQVDGFVARLTKSSNEFGKHLDSVTDFVGSSLVVPFFIYKTYASYNLSIAIVAGFAPLFVGVLREIIYKIETIRYPTCFIGLPRNTATLIVIAYINSNFFVVYHLKVLGLLVIALVSYLQISHIPFMGNDKPQLKFPTRIKFYLILCVVLQIGLTYLGLFWDGVVVFLTCYLIAPFVVVEKEAWQSIRDQCA